MKIKHTGLIFLMSLFCAVLYAQQDKSASNNEPLRLGIVGLSHAHLWEVISRLDRGDFEVVGIAEKNTALWNNKALKEKVASDLFFEDLDEMLAKTKPQAVIVYESIYDHLRVVEACAKYGVHVMVEKPLSTNVKDAKRMLDLAKENNIFLLTNYETTWYPTIHKAYDMIQDGFVGNLSRINIYDGHGGPIEIGCGPEFTDWLTDPVLNGGGAVIDFGCYGANISTWIMKGQKPLSVYAVLKQQKPAIYPKVDDDATIVIEYPKVTVIAMASWNWPISRKDMHIYGDKNYIYQDDKTSMRIHRDDKETRLEVPEMTAPYNDAFLYLKAVVNGDISVKPDDLSSPENNLTVVEILEAAIESSKTGKVIKLQ